MWLIPAHAGKTPGRGRGSRREAAHPRSRGENFLKRRGFLIQWGSSPLTRGKLDAEGPPALRGRLIPAHAGKTAPGPTSPTSRRAHPRSRGENVDGSGVGAGVGGSSPLTRGKPPSIPLSTARAGLIPAHAGKTDLGQVAHERRRAHPRSRGENTALLPRGQSARGSSPLTRGKPRSTCSVTRSWGLIPAHAGKTRTAWPRSSACPAHPRSRGENRAGRMFTPSLAGSSPLTRGKHRRRIPVRINTRLIPAHAGKTQLGGHIDSQVRAHPRSRGENVGR